MGKDSLIKSTSKKKKAAAKTAAKKKAVVKKAAPKKTAKKKAVVKKAAPKKTVKKKAVVKKAAPKKTVKKKAVVKKAAPKKTVKKKAVAKKAAPKKAAPKKKAASKKAAAGKAVSKTVAAKKAAPKKAPAKKLTVKELLNLKFEWPHPGKVFKPARVETKFPEPPPFIASTDKKEFQRIKAVLTRSFDMSEIRAADRKAAAEKVKVSYDKPSAAPAAPAPPVDRIGQYFTFGAAGIAILLFLLVIGASMKNADTYYLKPAEGAVEIWQGKFAPLGEKLLVTLPGVPAPEEIQPQYKKEAVFPLIYAHYIDKADALLAAPGFPDFEEIKKYLGKALKFAHTSELEKLIYTRIDGIDITIYMYKANVAASRVTREDLKIALDHLDSATTLNPDENLLKLIEQKRVIFSETLAAIEARTAEEARAAEKALAAQEQAATEEAGQEAAQEPGPAEGQQAAVPDHK